MRPRGAGVICVVLLPALLLAACGSGGTSSIRESPTGAPAGSVASVASAALGGPPGDGQNVGLSRLTDVRARQRVDAAILVGFDASSVVDMVVTPPSLDFANQALLCLHIGERATGGWSVALQSIGLVASEMRILARVVEPGLGAGVTEGFTYPADCAVIDRTVLPLGPLTLHAVDATSGELIVDGAVQVPAR